MSSANLANAAIAARIMMVLLDNPQEADLVAQLPSGPIPAEFPMLVYDGGQVRVGARPFGHSNDFSRPDLTCGHEDGGLVFMTRCVRAYMRSDLCAQCYFEAVDIGPTPGALNCDCRTDDFEMCLSGMLRLGRFDEFYRVMHYRGGDALKDLSRTAIGQGTVWRKSFNSLFTWGAMATLQAMASDCAAGRQVREFLAREPRMAKWTLLQMLDEQRLANVAEIRSELERCGKFVFGEEYQSEDEKFRAKYDSSGMLYWGENSDATCGKTVPRDESEGDECLLCCGEYQGHMSCCGKPVCRRCYSLSQSRQGKCPWCTKPRQGMCVGVVVLSGKKRGKEEALAQSSAKRSGGGFIPPPSSTRL